MSKSPGLPGTRTASDHFLVGQAQSDLGKDAMQGKLPITKDVMKYFLFRKGLPEFKFKSVELAINCPLKSCSIQSNCKENPKCLGSQCVVSKVKEEGNWIRAGLPIMSDLSISIKLKKLYEEHRALSKNKNKPNSDIVKREKFSEKMDDLFDISVQGVEDHLEGDRLRDQDAREEDLRFLEDQRDTDRRKMCVSKVRDENYDAAVLDKLKRVTRDERMASKISDYNDNIEINNSDNEVLDEDKTGEYEPPRKHKKKDDLVTLTINRKKFAKDTAITAKRHKIGIAAQRDMLANVINVGGGDIAEFSLSNKTVRKAGTATVKETAEKIKKDFKKVVEEDLEGKESILIYFDGKALAQFHDNIKLLRKEFLSLLPPLSFPLSRSWGSPSPPPTVARTRRSWL